MILNCCVKSETIGRYGSNFYALDGNYFPNLLSARFRSLVGKPYDPADNSNNCGSDDPPFCNTSPRHLMYPLEICRLLPVWLFNGLFPQAILEYPVRVSTSPNKYEPTHHDRRVEQSPYVKPPHQQNRSLGSRKEKSDSIQNFLPWLFTKFSIIPSLKTVTFLPASRFDLKKNPKIYP
jgi:hypothetical protein